MAQTFDIRFARSAGLAALLEVPGNRFHWKGGGQLRIDAKSISFTVKRSLRTLFGGNRTRRILAENLREVYREGEALRVEFETDETARVVLPFWAGDRDIAAQIVRLMPTSHTVEIEHSTDATHSGKPGADWRVLMLLGAAAVALAVGIWTAYRPTDSPIAATPAPVSDRTASVEVLPPTPDSTAPRVETPAPPVPSTTTHAQRVEAPAFPLDTSRPRLPTTRAVLEPSEVSAPSMERESQEASEFTPPAAARTSDGVVPFASGMSSDGPARRQLDLFLAESNTLRGYFLDKRYASNSLRFGEIDALWWKVTVRVTNSPDFEDPSLRPLQEIELAVSRAWRRAFLYYEDPSLLVSADAEVEFAERLEARARQFVR